MLTHNESCHYGVMRRFRDALSGCACAAALVLAAASVQAQQNSAGPEVGTETEQQSAPWLPVLYLEPGVAIPEGIDFELPPPEFRRDPGRDADSGQRSLDIQQFTEAIADSETMAGAWDGSLVEQLTALGALQLRQGDYLGSIETHDRAMHVQRINTGLHSIDQTPLVGKIIESYEALGDWPRVDVYQNYLFFIQQKYYGGDDPRLIPALGELAQWHTRAFRLRQGESLAVRLSSAQMLYKKAASMVQFHFGNNDERYVEFLRGVAQTAYLVARNQDLMRELARAQYRVPQETLRDTLAWSSAIIPTGFRAGEDALAAVREHYRGREGEVEQLARATAELADWYLLFNRRNAASSMYQEAWEALAEAENADELRRRMFGQARQMPVFASDDSDWLIEGLASTHQREDVSHASIDLSFDVTRWGQVRNLQTLGEESGELASKHSWIRRQVRESRFRPVLRDGMPVRANAVQFKYRFWY